MRTITKKQLIDAGATCSGLDYFADLFGETLEIKVPFSEYLQALILGDSQARPHWAWLVRFGFIPAFSMQKWNLSGADLSRADLNGADLNGADLNGADLRWAHLSGANLRWAHLSGAHLNAANLYGANLRWADLSGADLRWADLSGANLSRADLNGANLNGANLSRANLRWADLSRANLSRVDLRWANLSRVDLRRADLSGANYNEYTRWPDRFELPIAAQEAADPPEKGEVYQHVETGRKFVILGPKGIKKASAAEWTRVADRPHGDGDFSYICNKDSCRCMQ